jgi:hypothetical protein
MTIMTAENTIDRPARITRRTITSFLAGVILAGTVAVGVNVAAGEGSSSEPATAGTHVAHVAAVQEPGCFVLRGAC